MAYDNSDISTFEYFTKLQDSNIETFSYILDLPFCEDVVFNPSAGEYIDTVTVELSCLTEGAEIRYTIDDSIPTETSLLYTVPQTLNTSANITARAFKVGYNPSNIIKNEYKIWKAEEEMLMEQQAAGLGIVTLYNLSDNTTKTFEDTPLDSENMISIVEGIQEFFTKFSGGAATEALTKVEASKYTLSLPLSDADKLWISSTMVKQGTKYYFGANNGKTAKQFKIVVHPMYAGSDLSDDTTVLKANVKVTNEITHTIEGKELTKLEFSMMASQVALATAAKPTTSATTGTLPADSYFYRIEAKNGTGNVIPSASSDVNTLAAPGGITVNFVVPSEAVTIIRVWRSDDAEVTWKYRDCTPAEFTAGSFTDTGALTWTSGTIPVATTAYFYSMGYLGE